MPESRRKYALAWAIGLVVVAVALTFGPLVRCSFTDWDDQDTIWSNPHMKPATWSSVGYYWTHAEGELYIPLTYTVWAGLARIAPLRGAGGVSTPNPAVFHAANIVIHLIASIIALLLLRRLIGNTWAACAGALLFALHPLQTEAVAWASGMKDLLCGMFVLTAVWQYLVWVERRSATLLNGGERGGRVHYVIAIVALMLGTLCKPTAVVAPLLALLIDALLIRKSWRAAIASLWPWFLAIVPCIIWTHIAQPASLGAHVTLMMRPVVAADALAFYLWKLIAPLSLTIDYGRNPTQALTQNWIYFTWIAPAAVAIALFAARKTAPALACAGLVAVAALAPVLGFVPFEFQIRSTVADHYLYISMLAAALAVSWFVARAPKRAAFYAAAIVLGLLSLRTMDQTRCWNDSRALFTHAITVNPRSDVAFQNLGVLAGFDAETAEAKAELYLEQHDLEHAHEERAEAMKKLAESDAFLARVLELKPGDASALHSRAALHARFGRHEEAIADLRALVKELPKLREDERKLFAHDDDLLGRELIMMGRPGEALVVFEQMLAEDPGDRAALRGKDRALVMLHQASTQPSADARGEPRG